ncbi:MarR family transcriptional regulator [Eubacteriales bacterium OttesenSCG-928-A19]|nr:MarR family transcriptional regulator [Eubacteriales bacterium OttesenSCG-928-A19]
MDRQALVIAGLRAVLNKLSWLNGQEMKVAFEGLSASEVHCIEHIGDHQDANVTRLAEALYQTRGGISKITKKLLRKGIIEGYQRADNRKEVYFRLTPQGEAVHRTHAKLHEAFRARDQAVFDRMTEAQFGIILDFLGQYGRHLDSEIAKQNRKP